MASESRITKLERALNIKDQGPEINEVIIVHANGKTERMTQEEAKENKGEYIRIIVHDKQDKNIKA